MSAAEREVQTLGAFRGCECSNRNSGIAYAATMEWTGPEAVIKILEIAERQGAIHPEGPECVHHFAVLDLLDERGDVVYDRCIRDRATWDWWVRAVELRATSSDCPTCEPAVYKATYGMSGGDSRG